MFSSTQARSIMLRAAVGSSMMPGPPPVQMKMPGGARVKGRRDQPGNHQRLVVEVGVAHQSCATSARRMAWSTLDALSATLASAASSECGLACLGGGQRALPNTTMVFSMPAQLADPGLSISSCMRMPRASRRSKLRSAN
jgi:hypothetical protein